MSEAVDGRVPLAVTVSDRTANDQAAFGRAAAEAGAGWLILQPAAVRDVGEREHIRFFGRVADAVGMPVGLQIAPAYLGQSFAPEGLIELHRQHPNVQLMKLEMSALGVDDFIRRTEGVFDVFNGQAGVGLIDCIEAGCVGFIPGAEMGDVSSRIFSLLRSGNAEGRSEAEALSRRHSGPFRLSRRLTLHGGRLRPWDRSTIATSMCGTPSIIYRYTRSSWNV